MNKEYFATLPKEEVAQALYDKVEAYRDETLRNGRLGLWRKAYRKFFALDAQYRHEASEIQRGGEQGELSLIKANHFRNLLTHLHVILTQQRPAFDCRAINSDYKSQTQTLLGTNILDFYMREKGLEMHFRQALEFVLLYAEAYVEVVWNRESGEIAGVDEEGSPIFAGDIDVRIYPPERVIRSCRSDADLKLDWYILEREISKFELAAQYPEHAEKILDQTSDNYTNRKHLLEAFAASKTDDDTITIHTFYHDRTRAVPMGRQVTFLGSELVLEDSHLQYAKMPVHRIAAYNQHGTSFGYSISFDLLCVQDAIDLLYSTVLSNQAAFGVQSVWIKKGSGIDETQLASGLNVIESAEKPEPINLTNTPPEIFNFMKQIEQLGEMLSGVNSVARGQPEASLKSGAALALVASQAVQFSNGIQAAYVKMMEEAGTMILKTIQRYASIPRTAAIAGKTGRSYVKEFVGEDIDKINRVIVDMGNPMARLAAGRSQMAKDLIDGKLVKSPEQYMQVITTGRLEPLIEDEQNEFLTIRKENEALRDGLKVPTTAIDMHVDHIKSHRSVLSDPEARATPELVANTLDHIQEHINHLKTVDPALLQMLGMNSIAPPMPPPGPPGPGGPNQGPPPGAQPQDLGQMGAPPPPQTPNLPPEIAQNMPEMPTPPPMPQPGQ
jgi:hypothetical protein